jgi:two-component system sensor histidine kinase SenX3
VEWSLAVGWNRRSGRAATSAATSGPGRDAAPGAEGALAVDGLAALKVGVLVLDPGDRPLILNPAAVDLGLVTVRDGQSPQQVHTVIRTLAGQVRRSGLRREVELDLPRGGGRDPLGVHVRVVPLGGAEYGPGHVAVEASDVTEAHRVARVRRDFVANVSHELKTPVGALALLAETLLEAEDDPDASRRFAERIHHESRRLARLVAELLELSRLQGAEPLPEPLPVSVDRIINEVIDRVRTAATARSIDVTFAGTRGLTVYGSETQLVTAVANLAENAIAYSPEETRVTLTTRGDADAVEIAVVDHGIGIAPKDLDRIFERFYRADQARSRDTGGTGLGLAIVRHIAVNHGGHIDVSSAVGIGSTFTLRLPARSPEATLPLPPGVEIDSEGSELL